MNEKRDHSGAGPSVAVTATAAWVQRQSRIRSRISREDDDQVTLSGSLVSSSSEEHGTQGMKKVIKLTLAPNSAMESILLSVPFYR